GYDVRQYHHRRQPRARRLRFENDDRSSYKYWRARADYCLDYTRHPHLLRRVSGVHGFVRAVTNARAAYHHPGPDRPGVPGPLRRKTEDRPLEWRTVLIAPRPSGGKRSDCVSRTANQHADRQKPFSHREINRGQRTWMKSNTDKSAGAIQAGKNASLRLAGEL